MNTSKKHLASSVLFLAALLLFGHIVTAQDRFFTKTGSISFHSKTELEDIKASNRIVTAVLDTKTGAIQFSVPMKAFEFQKGLMQEHFNENYVESDKYPSAAFKGKILNYQSVKYAEPGEYNVNIDGELTLHGVTQKISAPAKLVVSKGRIDGECLFRISLADYKISIPSIVADKISKTVDIVVKVGLLPLNR